jgi:hypothetical protein
MDSGNLGTALFPVCSSRLFLMEEDKGVIYVFEERIT